MFTTSELKNQIILELLFSNFVQLEEKIDYEKFQFLHQHFSYLSESFFASILGIKYINFRTFKKGYHKVVILRGIKADLFHEIKEELLQKGIIRYNQTITYEEFLNIQKQVPFLSENMLANILEISISRLQNLRVHNGLTTKILKRFEISEEEEAIVTDLINQNLLYPGMQMTHEIFKKIHSFFPHIKEYRFAYILEMKPGIFCSMKRGVVKPIVLKSRIIPFVEKQKNDIITFLINSRNAKLNEVINFKRFKELYLGFEYISDVTFAKLILGINYNSFKSLKFNHKKATMLRARVELSDQACQNLFKDILKTFQLVEGDPIDYTTFNNIINHYKSYLSEADISYILGIEQGQFYSLKYSGTKARVINGITRTKINFMKKHFSENRFYSKEEIYKYLEEYGISFEDFVIHIINNRQFFITDDYVIALEQNNGLYIGKTSIDPEFFNQEYQNIQRELHYIWYLLLNIDIEKEKDDIFQELMIYIYQNCGDLYYNFKNSEPFFRKMKNRAKKYIIGKLIDSKQSVPHKTISLSTFEATKPIDRYQEFEDSSINVEQEVVDSISDEESLYEQLLSILEKDGSLEDCLKILENTNKQDVAIYTLIKNKLKNNS